MPPPDLGSIVGNIGSGAQNTLSVLMLIGIMLLIGFGLIFFIIFFVWRRNKYNLVVNVKKLRSDGKIVSCEMAKGSFNAKRGVVYLKRKKTKEIPMAVFDIRRYLLGESYLEVIQVGPEDFRPVLNDSWTEYVSEKEDKETGKIIITKESMLNLKVDTGMHKAWKTAWEIASAKAYSLRSFIEKFQVPIAIAIVIVSVFVGIAILWARLPTVCGH